MARERSRERVAVAVAEWHDGCCSCSSRRLACMQASMTELIRRRIRLPLVCIACLLLVLSLQDSINSRPRILVKDGHLVFQRWVRV